MGIFKPARARVHVPTARRGDGGAARARGGDRRAVGGGAAPSSVRQRRRGNAAPAPPARIRNSTPRSPCGSCASGRTRSAPRGVSRRRRRRGGHLPAAFRRGLGKTEWWGGRAQTVPDAAPGGSADASPAVASNLTWYLDGAHTEESMRQCAEWLCASTSSGGERRRVAFAFAFVRAFASFAVQLHGGARSDGAPRAARAGARRARRAVDPSRALRPVREFE